MAVKTLLIEYDDAHGDVMGGYTLRAPAVEVVRCMDYKWCMAYWKGTYCDRFAHALPTADLDGFCAWGDRSDG